MKMIELISQNYKVAVLPSIRTDSTVAKAIRLRQFIANVDPKTATPGEIAKMRRLATGNQLTGITGGLSVQEKDQDKDKK